MKVIAFTGLPCSGKDVACEYIAKKRDYTFLSCGDVIRECAKARGVEVPTRRQLQEISYELRKSDGETWLLKRLLGDLQDGNYIVTGIRGLYEVKFLKENFGHNSMLVGLLACEATRFGRCLSRGRPGDATTLAAFRKADETDIELGGGDSTVLSDHFIINEGTLDEFHRDIDKVLQAFSRSGR